MGEADLEGGEAKFASSVGGCAVQVDDGFAAPVVQDFEFTPEDAAHAGAERLGDGFLACEAGGEFFGAAAAVLLLALGVETPDEAVAKTVDRGLDAGDFDGIDAGGQAAIAGANSR